MDINNKIKILSDYRIDKDQGEKIKTFNANTFVLLSDDITEKELNIYKEYDYAMLYGEGNPILIKADAPTELKEKVLAAAMSFSLRIKSIDYVMRTYFKKE